MAQAFLAGKVSLSTRQCYLFIDGTDAVARMLLTGDESIKKEVFRLIRSKTEHFATMAEFESYYLQPATKLLGQIREFCGQDPAHFSFYERLLTRGKDNLTYAQWRKGLTIPGENE